MFEMRNFKHARRENEKKYREGMDALRARKASNAEYAEFTADCVHDDEVLDEQFALFLSSRVIDEARELDIEVPTDTPVWDHTDDGERAYLKAATRAELRKRVDEEKTRRFEAKTLWITRIILPLAGLLVGIIGALTAFVSVMNQRQQTEKKNPVSLERLHVDDWGY
jgi:hypothetical protein